MKKLYQYLTGFIKEDFHPGIYFTFLIFAASLVILNYSIDLEDTILDNLSAFPRTLGFISLYAAGYFGIWGIIRIFKPDNQCFSKVQFWQIAILGVIIISLESAKQFFGLFSHQPYGLAILNNYIFRNISSLFIVLVPILIYRLIWDKNETYLYGLKGSNKGISAYFSLFLFVIPIVLIGALLPGFEGQYPVIKPSEPYLDHFNIPVIVTVAIQEIAYATDFFSLEFIFRGFLVVGISRFAGTHAVLPMVMLYGMIHFGKPLGECVSSFFGGYILGAFAYRTNNIYGGIIIHIGLAWLMEIVSALYY